jgi:hypothetical protein
MVTTAPRRSDMMRPFKFDEHLVKFSNDIIDILAGGEDVDDSTRSAVTLVLRSMLNNIEVDELSFRGFIIMQVMSIVNHHLDKDDCYCFGLMSDCHDVIEKFLLERDKRMKMDFEKRKNEARQRLSQLKS